MDIPMYVTIENREVEERLEKIKGALREIEDAAAFISRRQPMLCQVPAPCNDRICVKNLTVLGVSALSSAQIERLETLLQEFV